MRVCGGWVRDKLIGKESDDIDISLDDMLGQDLADMIAEKQGMGKGQGYGLMKSNKEKAKNLDVAVTKIEGLSIDLVNLRHEDHASEQENADEGPKFGTPKMDAEGRDFTLNAIFYNINECKIEDFTNQGI